MNHILKIETFCFVLTTDFCVFTQHKKFCYYCWRAGEGTGRTGEGSGKPIGERNNKTKFAQPFTVHVHFMSNNVQNVAAWELPN